VRTLAIECSTGACSAALFEDGALVAGRFELLGRGHAERLVPMVAELPDKGCAERIAVGLGPGSFTGVRVALAAARALALAWGSKAVGFSTLALVAAMARNEVGPAPVGVAMTGGHGEWFVETFGADGASLRPLASLRPEEAASKVQEEVIAGSQAEALVTARGFGQALPILPDARELALLGEDALLGRLDPIYGRGPDAKLPGVA